MAGDRGAQPITLTVADLEAAWPFKRDDFKGRRAWDDFVGTLAERTIPADGSHLTVGSRTLIDLPHGDLPDQLVPPFLTPEGDTIIYAPGGSGKGWLAIYFALELVRKGSRVMVIDYEHHEHEWGNRARMLGATDEELAAIAYRAPFGDDWTAQRGSLSEVAALLRADADRLGVGYVIVDSYTASTSTGDTMGGQASAQEYFSGLRIIGRPSLTIAHVTGAAERFPAKPFGSVFVHNFARETWAVEDTHEGEVDVPFDPTTFRFQPKVMTLELRNRKRNGGPGLPAQFVAFEFFADGHVEVTREQPKPKDKADMIHAILTRAEKALTVAAIVKALKDEFEVTAKAEDVRRVLTRNLKRFSASDAGIPTTWVAL